MKFYEAFESLMKGHMIKQSHWPPTHYLKGNFDWPAIVDETGKVYPISYEKMFNGEWELA